MTKISNLYSLTNYIDVNSNGNVVIAAPTSGLALDVNGTGRFTGALTLGAIENISITNAGQTTFLKLTNLNGGLGDTANIDFSISGGGTTMSRISSVRDTIASVADISLAFSTFNVSLTEKMRILGNGNVGIGTASPIGGAGASDRTLSINSGAGAASFVTGMVNGTRFSTLFTSSSSVVLETNAAIPLAFNTNGTERLRITSSGNVGIGTTNPEARLMINGDWADMTGTITYSTNTKGIILNQDGGGGQGMGLWFRQAGLTAGIGSTRVSSGDWATDLRFYTHPSSTTNQNTLFERMRINSEGNVGIGTTSPANPEGFQRFLNISSNNAALVLSNTNGTTKNWSLGAYEDGSFRIVDGNNSRINVSSEGNLLLTSGTTVYNNTGSFFLRAGTSGDLILGAGGTNGYARIQSNGNLLVGTSSDIGGKLQVNGDIRAYGSFFRETGNITVNNSWTNVFTINTASQRTYLLQIIATNSEAGLSYRYFGVIQGNPANSSYTAVSLASQTMEVQFSGATIQTRLTNSNQFNFNWSITQLL